MAEKKNENDMVL
jgi:prefoldin beta subunit